VVNFLRFVKRYAAARCKDAFLPRDAMLARYMLYGPVSVRLCLFVKSVFYKNG